MTTASLGLSRRNTLRSSLRRLPPVIWALLLMIIFFGVCQPRFFSLSNAISMLCQGSILMILSLGVCVVTVAGGIDLSVGAVMTFSGMIMAWLLVNTSVPIAFILLATLLVGIAFGMLNGVFVSKMRIPSFIATLGTQGIALGLSLGMNKGYTISGLPPAIGYFGNGTFLALPIPIWLAVGAFLVTFVLLRFTPFGVYAYAIGGNEDALALAGKPSWLFKIFTFGYAGLMSGLAAIVVTARSMAAQPTVGVGMEFEAFSAAVLGGVFAGRGGAGETVLGVLFILILRNGLNVVGVPTYYQLAIIGMTLIVGMALSMVLERRLRR
jgi:ribose transport system permease protein